MPAHLEPSYDDFPIDLEKGIVVVGTDAKCDIILADSSVAARHFAIVNLEDSHVVCDLGTDDGVFVNGERVYGRQPIQTGDEIHVGEIGYVYRDRKYIPSDETKTVAMRTISPRDLEVVAAAVEHAKSKESMPTIPEDAKLSA
ncbi:FHA domain-containing protein, partial [bacterium]|nr:FHA domain-containing protein [bacterium]